MDFRRNIETLQLEACAHREIEMNTAKTTNSKPVIPLLPALLAVFCTLFGGSLRAQERGLTLERAIETARARNERALSSEDRMSAADATVSRARSAFFPSLNVTGTYTRRAFETKRTVGNEEITIQSLNALRATATADMPLLNPRLFSLYAQAANNRDAAKAGALNDRRLLSFDVANAFLLALNASQVARAAEHRHEYARMNMDAARARFEAQITRVNDVTRAELELATAEREQTNAHGNVHIARLNLSYFINEPPPDSLVQPDRLLQEAQDASPRADSLLLSASGHRLDVIARRAGADALRASSNEAVLRAVPSLTANAQYQATNEAGFSGKSTNWYVGANLSWTIFDGGVWLSDRSERAALARAAELETTAAERQVELEISTALVSLASAQASMKLSNVALDAAVKNADETSVLYRQGLASALEAADAGVRLFEAEVAASSARLGLAIAFLNLRAAVGQDPFGNPVTFDD
jgi:outer membrane protein TolC